MGQYFVKKINKPVDLKITVPGSKSITNRALLLAAMVDGKSNIKNVLYSNDTEVFIEALKKIGYNVEKIKGSVNIYGDNILNKDIEAYEKNIYVGSAGTAARFLTAALSMSNKKYDIDASLQMKKRPMRSLFSALMQMGASFEFMEEPWHLPARVNGIFDKNNLECLQSFSVDDKLQSLKKIEVDSDVSTQFLSALLMVSPLYLKNQYNIWINAKNNAFINERKTRLLGIEIIVQGSRKNGSYIKMTIDMMRDFGVEVRVKENSFLITSNYSYKPREYEVEPDVSAACYFYAMAALTGGKTLVKGVHKSSIQGDIQFLYLLEKMGCSLVDTQDGILLCGKKDGKLKGIDVDMKDFSDQSLTLAALAPFCSSSVRIRNISHIRKQESDRIKGMVNELTKMGIKVVEYDDGVEIFPGTVNASLVNTYDDHRMAMAFSIIGLMVDGIVIDDFECCSKTFKNYFDILDTIYD